MNIDNFKKVLNQIKEYPHQWNQEMWHHESTHCFGGWCQIFHTGIQDQYGVRTDTMAYLNISEVETNWLVDALRTLVDFDNFLKEEGIPIKTPVIYGKYTNRRL